MKYTNTPFELFDGTKCMLHVAVGEVIQNDAREVQDVHVSNDQTKVYTSKTQRQAIWLRDDNGGEKEIHLDAIAPFSVRVGQTMAVAMASSDQTSPMFLAEGRNLKTGGWSTTNEDRLFKQVVPNAFSKYRGSLILWLLMVGCVYLGYTAYAGVEVERMARARVSEATHSVPGCLDSDITSQKTQAQKNSAYKACADNYRESPAHQSEVVDSAKALKDAQADSGARGPAAVIGGILLFVLMFARRARYAHRLQAAFFVELGKVKQAAFTGL